MSGEKYKFTTYSGNRVAIVRGKIALAIIFAMMIGICGRFGYLQLVDPHDYRTAALDQYTSSVTISAKRGTIYANDGATELAVSATVYNCFISPYDIKKLAEDSADTSEPKTESQILNHIADNLSVILSVDREEIINKGQRTNSQYQMIKKFLTETEEDAIRAFVDENDYVYIVNLEETTKRYYRNGTFACHLLGFTGTDNQGLSGIEAVYDSYLSGVDGKSVKAADGYGNELDSGVGSTYIPATDGLNVVTTLDWSIQNTVEKYILQAYEEHKPEGRVECIVMDVDNGEILSSAIYPNFDPNNYTTLTSHYQEKYSLFEGTDDERSAYKNELLYEMWNNTIATQTYEPGSTFKIIASAIALEENAISYETSTFNCTGVISVGSTSIHCHHVGHGLQNFSEAIKNSCNPAFVQIGTAVGITNYKKYFEEFGYSDVTGSDLLGEVSSIYYGTTGSQFQALELAIYSFGQTFKVTPLQHLRAMTAVANGGYLVVPHTVKSLVDNNGNTVKTFDYPTDRQVVSQDTCQKIINSLINSTKNASVSGYNIIAKTGTSEKRDTEDTKDYISSCVAFAPAEDPQVAVLVLVDDPTSGQFYGSAVAAPIVSNILSEVLPHLGIAPNVETDNKVTIPNFVAKTVDEAREIIEGLGLECIVRGEGDENSIIVDQFPRVDTVLTEDGVVIIYTEGTEILADAKVPNVMGCSPSVAIERIVNAGLNVSINGIFNDDHTNCTVVSQSVSAGEYVLPGTVIELEFLYEEDIE